MQLVPRAFLNLDAVETCSCDRHRPERVCDHTQADRPHGEEETNEFEVKQRHLYSFEHAGKIILHCEVDEPFICAVLSEEEKIKYVNVAFEHVVCNF